MHWSSANYLNFTIRINWKDGKPVILIVVCVKILPFNGHFAKNFILLQVAVPIVHIHRQVTELTGHIKLELLPKKWAANKLNINTTVKDQQLNLQHTDAKLASRRPQPTCGLFESLWWPAKLFKTVNTDYNLEKKHLIGLHCKWVKFSLPFHILMSLTSCLVFNLKNMYATFGSTYLCEQFFSLMKSNERSRRPKFTDTHPLLTIKVATT